MTERSQRPVWLGVRSKDERTFDHIRVHVQLLDDPRVGVYHLAVYLGIARHAEVHGGAAHPSAATLARYGGLSERKARTVIDDLEAWGYLRVEERSGNSSVLVLLPPPKLSPGLHHMQASRAATPAPHDANPCTSRRATPAPGAAELDPLNKNQELGAVVVPGSGLVPPIARTDTPMPVGALLEGIAGARSALHGART